MKSLKSPNYATTNIMSYDVFTGDLDKIDFFNRKKIINTINPHSYIIAKKDKSFRESLRKSDILLPDGSGIILAVKYINSEAYQKNFRYGFV